MFLVSDIEAFWTVSLYKVGYILVTDFFNRCIQSAECMNRNLKFRRKINKKNRIQIFVLYLQYGKGILQSI